MHGRVAAAAALALLLTACSAAPSAPANVATGTWTAVELTCTGSVTTGPLPAWARDGFTPPDQSVPHVLGVGGDIVGVVFGHPLRAPAVPDHGNKILWVPRPGAAELTGDPPPSDLTIDARLNGVGTTTVLTIPGGPGPSTVDMPAAGCWTMKLHWDGRTDVLAVPYLA